MTLDLPRLQTIISDHADDISSVVIVGHLVSKPASAAVFSFEEFLDGAAADSRWPLGLCIDPQPEDVHSLARMRDVHCEQVIVIQTMQGLSPTELLALGFQKLSSDQQCTVFLCSADINDIPRDWNNAKHWANPENFDKGA